MTPAAISGPLWNAENVYPDSHGGFIFSAPLHSTPLPSSPYWTFESDPRQCLVALICGTAVACLSISSVHLIFLGSASVCLFLSASKPRASISQTRRPFVNSSRQQRACFAAPLSFLLAYIYCPSPRRSVCLLECPSSCYFSTPPLCPKSSVGWPCIRSAAEPCPSSPSSNVGRPADRPRSHSRQPGAWPRRRRLPSPPTPLTVERCCPFSRSVALFVGVEVE